MFREISKYRITVKPIFPQRLLPSNELCCVSVTHMTPSPATQAGGDHAHRRTRASLGARRLRMVAVAGGGGGPGGPAAPPTPPGLRVPPGPKAAAPCFHTQPGPKP